MDSNLNQIGEYISILAVRNRIEYEHIDFPSVIININQFLIETNTRYLDYIRNGTFGDTEWITFIMNDFSNCISNRLLFDNIEYRIAETLLLAFFIESVLVKFH
jgi:hypothetical protein